MSDTAKTKKQLLNELSVLHRKVAELNGLEDRCNRAEEALQAIEQRDRLLGDIAPFGIFTIDAQGKITGFNSKMTELASWPLQADSESVNFFDIPAFQKSGIIDDIRRCLADEESIISDYPHLTAKGEAAHLRFYLRRIPGADGSGAGVMAFVEEISKLKQAEEALRDSEKKYRLLFQSAPIALVERDASGLKAYLERLRASGVSDFRDYLKRNPQEIGRCMGLIKTVDYNDAYLELLEAGDGEEFPNVFAAANPEEFQRLAREVILMVAGGSILEEREATFWTVKGNPKSVLGKSLVISGHEQTLARIVIALVDITKRKQAEKALQESEQRFREEALRDNLTGLYNRRYLYQSLSSLIEASKANGSALSVIFMDLDNFKKVVDTHGHLNGSQAIQEVAATIQNSLEAPAYAVAYAGDEFVVVLPGLDQKTAEQKALEIRDRIKNSFYLCKQNIHLRLQASFGIATCPDDATDLTDLLAAADRALFGIKENGKDGIGRGKRVF